MDENKNNLNNNPNLNFDNNENQENPYYNPYFQNTDLSSSPYFAGNGINLNNDIYTNENNNNSNFQDNTNNIQNNINQNTLNNEAVKSPNTQDNSSLNLFDLASDDNSNVSQSQNRNNNFIGSPSTESLEENQSNFNNDYITNTTVSNNSIENNNENYYNINQNNTRPINPILNNSFVDSNENIYQEESTLNNSQNFQDQSQQEFDNINNFNTETNQYGIENDETFRKTWMGNLYEKANAKQFNIAAFFFTGFYFFYRKLYLWGFLFILLGFFPIINNIICGFAFYPLYKSHINKNLNNYKNSVQSPNQLIDIAKKKGGTSALSAILAGLFLFVIPLIIIFISFFSILSSFLDLEGDLGNPSIPYDVENDVDNSIYQQPTAEYEYYNFYNDYDIEYNASSWTEDPSGNSLVNGNYKLSFMQALENLSSLGYDISTDNGRSNFFTFLYNQFSSQIDASTTLELGSSNFSTLSNGIYYSYIDLIYATSMERCYFILLPDDDIFIEFILSNQDTIIPDSINTEVLEYLSSIKIKNVEFEGNTNVDSNNTNFNSISNENIIGSTNVNNVNVNSNNTIEPSEILLY